ncbi:hybrid sensor histidine kinase/response regulator [Anaeromyxobacter terrae]|uniref:hybrid sensor histidine kinase/response regulator n=1 Tax=Anaeromyxobacter terrae TaxID=2925406 RepID=UPI001F57242E|nr:ATP-binding protein [Anaeromyxobacter sp. SG22]
MTDPLPSNVRILPVARAPDLFTGSPATLFDALSAASPDGFLITAADGRLLAANERLFELWGIPATERAEVRELGNTAAARQALLHALKGRASGELECSSLRDPAAAHVDEIVLRDGRVLERHVAPTLGHDGVPAGRVVVFHDITRRKRDENELRAGVRHEAALATFGELAMNAESVAPLLHAVCATTAGLLALDAAAVIEAGPAGATILSAARLAGDLRHARLPPADPPGGPGGHLAPLGFAAALEVALPGRDGPVRLLGAYARGPRAFSLDDERFLTAAASVLASALARSDAEQELIARERQLRAVFDGARDPMLIVDDGAAIVDANAATCALLGATRAGLAGRPLDEVAALATDGAGAGGWRALLAKGGDRGEAELEGGGRRRQVEVTVTTGILPGRALVALRDVTETRLLHARLALADRLASVGTLAAGVAHELNNPLAYVSANLAFLSDRLERVERLLTGAPPAPSDADLAHQLGDAVREARDGAQRMRVIVRDLRTFSRGEDDRSGPVDLAPVIASCINMARPEIRRRARLTLDLAPVPPVHGNAARLGQVFLNLLVNAAQAIAEGAPERNEIRVVTRALPDGRVAAEVRDTGCGIAAENLQRVFDPFFTTKPPGVGTGLGLSICHGIVTRLGGALEVESTPGAGASFRVVLPCARAAAGASGAATTARAARPRAQILVVDDEPLVATVLQRTLQADHDVVVAGRAREALERLGRGERFDAILCDLLMPEMSGMDLHRALVAAHDPHAGRMLFLTGGAFTTSARVFLDGSGVDCLEKPFELETLRAALARLLEGAGAAAAR